MGGLRSFSKDMRRARRTRSSPLVGSEKASELRQDPVTGKWVVIAKGRATRPQDHARAKPPPREIPAYLDTCPFCNLDRFPQAAPTLALPRGRHWRVQAFPNKFPAFASSGEVRARKVGLYTVMGGVGFHEILLVRPHNGFLSTLPREDLCRYVEVWRQRYRAIMAEKSVAYIQLIENHGPESGGSLEHSHLQLFAIPVIPSDEVLDLLRGAEAYADENGSCAYCDILHLEREEGTRIVWENDQFTVLCPFSSRVPSEQWVIPRAHGSGFETLGSDALPFFADALQQALRRLAAAFRDPGYNLYVYSAPCDTEGYVCERDEFSHFHWHVQILPRLNIWGGFELATGLEIHSVFPEDAAAYLRSF